MSSPIPEFAIVPAAAAFGAVFGSFLNVCIHRLPLDESVVSPRSRCPGCRRMIAWHDNIPIVSWILLRGRCRACGGRISFRYVVVEALGAALFVLAALRFLPDSPAAFTVAALLLLDAVAVAFIDYDHTIIPDELTLPLAALGPVLSALVPAIQTEGPWLVDAYIVPITGGTPLADVLSAIPSLPARAAALSIAGVFFGWGILAFVALAGRFLFRREAMGSGDLKWLAAIGGIVGPEGATLAFAIACLAGSVAGLVHLIVRRDHVIPFGPFLSIGAIAALLAKGNIIRFLTATLPTWIQTTLL